MIASREFGALYGPSGEVSGKWQEERAQEKLVGATRATEVEIASRCAPTVLCFSGWGGGSNFQNHTCSDDYTTINCTTVVLPFTDCV